MDLVGVVHVELIIAPATFSNFGGLDFGVVKENGVTQQQVGDAVTGLLTATLNRRLLVTTARANTRLVLEVMAEKTADFQIVVPEHHRKVVFPDVEIFTIGPRRLVPDI